MTILRVKKLQQKMPYKQIFFDLVSKCYRLIDPNNLYEYEDEEGGMHKRTNLDTLQLVV